MRFLLYNIRYGTGGQRRVLPWGGYLGRTNSKLDDIIEFLQPLDPDVVGLVEVDSGSYRSGRVSQSQQIADALGHYHVYRSKYCARSRVNRVPVMNKQGNAFLCRDSITNERFHYFSQGMKRLVIELELENVVIFLVHLALGFRVRHHQLKDLFRLVQATKKPHIVAGDFNALWGLHEMELFTAACGLRNANVEAQPTFPSWKPKRHLDFILHSEDINVERFWIPPVQHSDHLPLVIDFQIAGTPATPAEIQPEEPALVPA